LGSLEASYKSQLWGCQTYNFWGVHWLVSG